MSAPEIPAEEPTDVTAEVLTEQEPAVEVAPEVEPSVDPDDAPAVVANEESPAIEADASPVVEAAADAVAEAESPAEIVADAAAIDAPEASATDAEASAPDDVVPSADEPPPAESEPATSDAADAALVARTAIVEEAEVLAISSDWSKTSTSYRELLERWRAAGSAGRERDNALWARFAAARDAFYQARNAHHADRARLADTAAERKRALIAECEALLDRADPRLIGDGLDRLLEEWKQAGRAGSEDQTLWVTFRAVRDRAFTLRRELVAVRQRNRETAKLAKEALIESATSTPRELEVDALQALLEEQMAAWKKVGSAGREQDEALWLRFREARGAGFSRVRQAQQRKEREAANAARGAGDALEAAQRIAFSDATVSGEDVARLERQFQRGAAVADPDTKAQFGEALGKVRERAKVAAQAVPSGNPFAAARARQEQTVRDLENRIDHLKATGEAREVARVEKRLTEERSKLERMAALIGG